MAIKEINYYKLHFTYVYGGRNCFKNVNMRVLERERERERKRDGVNRKIYMPQTVLLNRKLNHSSI